LKGFYKFERWQFISPPQILVNSMKSVDLNENMGFKSTVFWCLFLKTWCFSGAKNGIIFSGYFCAAKCGNLLGRWEFGSNITQKVAILQAKIIPTIGGKDKMKPWFFLFTFLHQGKKVNGFGWNPIKKN
jgi:hypothetical protein